MILLLVTVLSMLLRLGTTQTCEDVDSAICQDLYGVDPNMCDNPCYSATLCSRFCGKCPLKCYTCHEVSSPAMCYTTSQCPSPDHFCITTQSFTDDFKEVYKLGCALNTICAAHFGPGIGRREANPSKRGQIDGSCCSTDLCNVQNRTMSTNPPVVVTAQPTTSQPATLQNVTTAHLTSQQTSVPAMTTVIPAVLRDSNDLTPRQAGLCHDVDDEICHRLVTNFPNVCSADCVANAICPRRCGKCMGCYQCTHVTNPQDCTHKTVCTVGQQCYSVETILMNNEQGFKLGCMDETVCSTFGHAAPNIFGKRQGFELSLHGGCCKGEFCNDHRLLPTTTLPPTTTSTVPPTTTGSGCPHYHHSCPRGWYHRHNSCFAIGTPAVDWTDAKAQCEARCAQLADFDSATDLRDTTADIGRHFASQTGSGTVVVWTDGYYSNGQWYWSGSPAHLVDGSLQPNQPYSGTYCGSAYVGPDTYDMVLSFSRCYSAHLPLCEIKHV